MGMNGIKAKAIWYTQETNPANSGVYPCRNLDGSQTCRSFEDGSWWYFGNDGWVPNNSFIWWAEVEPPEVVTAPAQGAA